MAAEQLTAPIPSRILRRATRLPATVAALAVNPDAELVAACRDYLAAVAAYNTAPDPKPGADDPFWQAIAAAEARAEAHPPTTMAGLAAMAAVAQSLAITDGHEGMEDWDNGPASGWSAAVVKQVLRLAGGEALA